MPSQYKQRKEKDPYKVLSNFKRLKSTLPWVQMIRNFWCWFWWLQWTFLQSFSFVVPLWHVLFAFHSVKLFQISDCQKTTLNRVQLSRIFEHSNLGPWWRSTLNFSSIERNFPVQINFCLTLSMFRCSSSTLTTYF